MKRTNNTSYLIVIDGMDRCGKDTLMDWIVEQNPEDYIVYKQPTTPSLMYRDPKKFEKYLMVAMQKVYEDIRDLHKKFPDKYILTSRLWISDDVYSTMFKRKHIVSKIYKDNFEDLFQGRVINLTLLWDSYNDFIDRMIKINDERSLNEYTFEEFIKVKELFEKYGNKYHSKIFYVKNETKPSKIYNYYEFILSSIF